MAETKGISKVANEFNAWQKMGRAESMQQEHIIAVDGALKEMTFQNGLNVLDVGCGNGYAVRLMADKILPSGKAYGVDIAENMVNTAKEKSAHMCNVNFQVANFAQLPFKPNFFDIVLSVESIYYAEDMLEAVKNVCSVLKPGGKFYCITYFFKEHTNSAVWADYIPITMHYLAEAEYLELFKQAGFSQATAKRIYDPRPVDKDKFKPKWGYNNVEELIHFKEKIGALLIIGTNAN